MRTWNNWKSGDFAQSSIAAYNELVEAGHTPRYDFSCGIDHGHDSGGPIALLCLPTARNNSFQSLLYLRAREHGIAWFPLVDVRHARQVPWIGRTILHLHWVGDVVRNSNSASDAIDRVRSFLDTLDSLKQEQNMKVVWTAHNILPHGTTFKQADTVLREGIIERADVVHLLSKSTHRLLSSRFPAFKACRYFVAEHPSYAGSFPDYVNRSTARHELGIHPKEKVFLLFGSIQRYKGLTELTSAVDALMERDPSSNIRVLIAGMPTDPTIAAEIKLWGAKRPYATVDAYKIPVEQVQYYFRAADYLVAPYQDSLNSGVLFLAMTFGLPVIAPDILPFSEYASYGVFLYDDHDERISRLEDVIAYAAEEVEPIVRVDSDAFERSFGAVKISDCFFQGLKSSLYSQEVFE